MHVRGHALAGSLLQLEAAAKACRIELQGGSLNYRWRDYVVGLPHGFGSGCTSRPSVVSYASVASGEKTWDSRLSCNSTNKLKHSESCLLATVGNTLWVCRISRVNSGVRALRLGLRQARNLVVRSSYIMHPIWVHDSGMQVWCNVKYSLKVPQSILNMSVNYFRRLKKYITLAHNI